MGRSGFTDDGGASMMSWLLDPAGSSSNGSVDKHNLGYFDPDYLVEHEFDDEEERAPLRHGQNVEEEGQNVVLMKEIRLLKSMVTEEERKSKKFYEAMINHEFELTFRDELVEELESKIVEGKKENEALMREVLEGKKKMEHVKVFAVACFSVAITLCAVLFCLFKNM